MPTSDTDLLRRIRKGERHLYARLVDRYKDRGMALAVRMLKNRLDAEEVLQDAFMRAYRGLNGFEENSSFGTWFYRILYNVCLSRLGSKKIDTHSVDFSDESGEEFDPALLASADLADEIEVRDMTRIVHLMLEELPEKYRTILTLFYLQERSHEEIGHITGLPIGTIKTQLFRARELLRKSIVRRLLDEGVAA
jgi:RNA polymerase sigma-70 factor, ECF subfamily